MKQHTIQIILCCLLPHVLGHPIVSSEDIDLQSLQVEGVYHHLLLTEEEDRFDSSENIEERSRRDVYNNEVLLLPLNSSVLFNHSYEVRCSPRVRLEVDGLTVDVKKDMQLVLRFICVLARTANASFPPHLITGHRFGYILSIEQFNATEFAGNSTGKRRFDVTYEDDSNNETDIYPTFSHTCSGDPPGANFRLGERTVKPLSVAWMLLNSLTCRKLPLTNQRNSTRDNQRDRRDIFRNNEYESNNEIEEKPSSGHQCKLGCDLKAEHLVVDGVKLKLSPHLQSSLHLLCSALPVTKENNGHFSFNANYITEIDLDMDESNTDSVANTSFDVSYEDGQKRRGRNLFTFYWRCKPEPIFSILGHKLASHCLLWNVINSLKCETNSQDEFHRESKEGNDAPDISAQQLPENERKRKDAPSQFHNFDVRCSENSKALIVDNVEVKITVHMQGAITFLCELLKKSKTRADEHQIYKLGYIGTEHSFNTEDYAISSTSHQMLDVVYKDGTVDTRTSVTVFGQTCFPYPLGPEFSLDAGVLQPRSIMWGLFSKVRCDHMETDSFAYFDPDLLAIDYARKEKEHKDANAGLYSNNHTYEVRCSLDAESLLVDGYVMEVTQHFHSALRILCYSWGLKRKQDSSIKLGYFNSIEYFNPQEYTINSKPPKKLDVMFFDGISRASMRVASMLPNCQSNPPQFEFNGKKVLPESLVWTLYKKLECDTRSSKLVNEPILRSAKKSTPLQKSNAGKNEPITLASNNHEYAIKCRSNSEKLIVDGIPVRVTKHMYRVLKLLCRIIEIFYSLPQDHIYRFGNIVTKESFKVSDYATNSTSHSRLDVHYMATKPRSVAEPISLKSTCRDNPPGNEVSLNGSRLVPQSIIWSLFSRLRCPTSNNLVLQEQTA